VKGPVEEASMNEAHTSNAEQIAYWNATAGETWARRREDLDRELDSLGRRAMEALSPAAGERLVDIGCGCGRTTLQLADLVGAGGSVLGVDISRPMLSAARQRAAGVHQVRFLEADAQTFAFKAGAADAVYSRFGVMFFTDPGMAMTNIRSALRPGGRIAFVCWRDVALNPFMTVPYAAALHLLPLSPPPTDPHAPGPFAFSDGERVRSILSGAGFATISVVPHDEAIGSGDLEAATSLALTIGPLGAVLRENKDLAGSVRDCVRSALAPHETHDGVMLGSASWIVTACNP
jgi:SAM-dependent methyltransferase